MFFVRLITTVLLSALFGTLLANGAGVDPAMGAMAFGGLRLATIPLSFNTSGLMMANVIDVSDLTDDYGLYYKLDPGAAERRKRLKDKLYNTQGKFDSYFESVETDSTREDWSYSEHEEVLQPYQTTYTPKGGLALKPNPAQLFWAKYDLSYIPDHLVLTYHSHLRKNNLSVDECPFVEYVIMLHIIPRGHQDWKTKVSFKGEYVEPTGGTASPAEETADGVRQIIRNMNTAGMVTPTTMGAIPSDPVEAYEYLEELTYAGIPEEHRDRDITWMMGDDQFRKIADGLSEKHNKFYERVKETGDVLQIYKKSNIKFAGFTEMEGSEMIFGTVAGNGLKLNKGSAKKEIMKVETLKRELYLFTDFHSGYHFANPTEVFANDQDLS